MSKENRVIYADLLRVVSIFAVVVLHVSALNWTKTSINSFQWQILNIYNSLMRWCVPVFIMLSGMFFLNTKKKINISKIYVKYIPRILFALIFYSIFYYIFIAIIDNVAINKEFLIDSVKNIIKGGVRYHLWFLYIIIGLYIMTPIMRCFIRGASKTDIEYYIVIGFIFASVVPILIQFEPFNKILISLNKFNIIFMMGYALYYILGYYLFTFEISKKYRNIIYILSILSATATIVLTYAISIKYNKANEIFYGYLTPNVMIMSIGVFLLFKYKISKINFKKFEVKIIQILSSLSFTIYLIHDAIMILIEKLDINLWLGISIPIKSISIFLISTVISYVILNVLKILKNMLLKV